MEEEFKSILKLIYEAREEELARLDIDDKVFIANDESNKKKKYYYLKKQVEKIPSNLNKLKKDILKAIEEYAETFNYENAYFNEKYYLNGLKDGIILMSEIKA